MNKTQIIRKVDKILNKNGIYWVQFDPTFKHPFHQADLERLYNIAERAYIQGLKDGKYYKPKKSD
jgi:uncharacterized protein YecE (DUF72 family)